MSRRKIDETGNVYGRLTVLYQTPNSGGAGKNLLLDYKKQKSSYKSCKSCKLNNKGGRQSWRVAGVCKTLP